MTLAVVIPAFNEGRRIGPVLAGMPDSVEGHRVAVVVVDDGAVFYLNGEEVARIEQIGRHLAERLAR